MYMKPHLCAQLQYLLPLSEYEYTSFKKLFYKKTNYWFCFACFEGKLNSFWMDIVLLIVMYYYTQTLLLCVWWFRLPNVRLYRALLFRHLRIWYDNKVFCIFSAVLYDFFFFITLLSKNAGAWLYIIYIKPYIKRWSTKQLNAVSIPGYTRVISCFKQSTIELKQRQAAENTLQPNNSKRFTVWSTNKSISKQALKTEYYYTWVKRDDQDDTVAWKLTFSTKVKNISNKIEKKNTKLVNNYV